MVGDRYRPSYFLFVAPIIQVSHLMSFRCWCVAALIATMSARTEVLATDMSVDANAIRAQRFEVYKELAEAGDSKAQLLLASFYYTGEVVPKDKALASQWLRKAADAGLPEAQEMYAMALSSGNGIERNLPEAQRWMRLAADAGRPAAQHMLGVMLLSGLAGEKNLEQARDWLGKAAQQNEPAALLALGTAHFDGSFGAPDYVAARDWLKQAFARGKFDAAEYLGQIAERGLIDPADPIEAAWWYQANLNVADERILLRLSLLAGRHPHWTVARADRLQLSALLAEADDAQIRERLQQAHDTGDALASFSMGVLLELGERGFTSDAKAAVAAYRAAAGKGLPEARYLLARRQLRGADVDRDPGQAKVALLQLAESGFVPAQVLIGQMLRFDTFGSKDVPAALRWLEQAQQNGSQIATSVLAYLYHSGTDVTRDYQKAFDFYLQAAKAGFSHAQRYVADRYRWGSPVKKDLAQARAWLTLSNRYRLPDAELEQQIEQDLRDKDRKKAARLVAEWQAQLPIPLAVAVEPIAKQ